MSPTKKNTTSKRHSSESLMLRGVTGILLIAAGVLSFLSLMGLVRSDVFFAIKRVALGLGGSLAYGVPLFLIWGGGLLAFSARSRAPVRALILLIICYICILTIINLIGTTPNGSLMEYIVEQNKKVAPMAADYESFPMFMSQIYSISSLTGQTGGAIGMLLAWPLQSVMGTVAGMVVMCVITITCLLCLSRFDLAGWYKKMKQRSDEKLALREQEQQARMEQERAVRENEKERPSSLFRRMPAFLRRRSEDEPPETPLQPATQPAYTPQQLQAMQYAAYQQQLALLQQQQAMAGYAEQPPRAAAPAAPVAQPNQNRTIYDEVIAPVMDMTENPSVVAPPRFGRKGAQTAQTNRRKIKEPPVYAAPVEPEPEPDGMFEAPPTFPIPSERKPIILDKMVEPQSAYQRPDGFEAAQTPSQKARTATQLANERLERLRENKQGRPKRIGEDEPFMSGTRLDKPELKLPPKSEQVEQTELELTLPYQYPTLELLSSSRQERPDTSAQDAFNGRSLEKTLRSFGIESRVVRVAHGPAITRFELNLLSEGINVSKIAKLADNIALDLAAKGGVRVEVPIPGTNLFGVEIPNDQIISVPLIDVLTSDEMKQNRSPLAVALGKDIAGRPVICDLSSMPHLLIAGQTGSGKSVCINTIINSILYRSSPEQVRMIMIDPKVVELQCYNVIPHLLIPVVSDPHKAAGALAWAVAEMLDRYQRIKLKNVRNIAGYNQKLKPGEEAMPHIVIIIDELSDLMIACRKEVEDSIIRIAQLARAAGIHLIVATQRPTVNVITGLIKANIPSRISFAVSSQTDSRTILDQNGAEKLLGKGDMLYMPTGEAPKRVQGCFLSDQEIERVMSFIEHTARTDFDQNILEVMESDNDAAISDSAGDEKADERLPEAIEMVITDGQASISMLQRRMKIGYARAGALIDEMARRGIVSKSAGSKPREVLITREQYDEMHGNTPID